MTFAEDLIAIARREWGRWGGPLERADGHLIGFTSNRMEADDPYWKYVGEYWRSIGSTLDGRDAPAWSGAFICYCFKEADAKNRFPYADNHSIYVSKIDGGKWTGLTLEDPATTVLAPGDLVWAGRSGDSCRKPPHTFVDARDELKKIRTKKADSFCSHSDIVVDVRDGEVDVIGGNVKQAVTRTTYKLDTQGRIRDGRRSFIGVIKNTF